MNRILINSAAAINIAAAALIYIACSGDDGKDGSVCTGVQTASGVNIVCDGQTVGTVNNGQDAPGAAGTCTVLPPGADGSLNANCGGQTYPLGGAGGGGCSISDGDAYYILTCGTTPMQIAKAWCGSTPYNPSKQVCDTDGNISDQKCGIHVINTDIHFCANGQKIPKCGATFTISGADTTAALGGVEYDVATQFCGYGITKTITGGITTIAWTASTKPDSVYTRCGTENTPNATVINPAVNHPKGIGWFNPSTQFCLVNGASKEINTLCRGAVSGVGGKEYAADNVCEYDGASGKVWSVCGPDQSNMYDPTVHFCQGTGANAKKLPLCGDEKLTYTKDEFCADADGKVYDRCGDGKKADGTSLSYSDCGAVGAGNQSQTCNLPPRTCTIATTTPCTSDSDCTASGDNCAAQAPGTCSIDNSSCTNTCPNTTPGTATQLCTDGAYNPSTTFCAKELRTTVQSPTSPVLAPTPKKLCNAKSYEYETEFCASTSKIYPRCGSRITGTSSDIADLEGVYDKSHYDVTLKYCPKGGSITTDLSVCKNVAVPTSGDLASTSNRFNPETQICDNREGPNPNDPGVVYDFIKVGNTQWLANNLKYNGSERTTSTVGKVYSFTAVANTISPSDGYGLLYSPTEISLTGANAICPEGWKVPNDTDWDALSAAAGGLVAALKSADAAPTGSGNSGVTAGNTWTVKGTDALGFNAWPAGKGVYTPDYEAPVVNNAPTPADGWNSTDQILYTQLKTHAYWWSSSPGSTLNLAKYRSIAFNDVFLLSGESNASTSFYSVRCVK